MAALSQEPAEAPPTVERGPPPRPPPTSDEPLPEKEKGEAERERPDSETESDVDDLLVQFFLLYSVFVWKAMRLHEHIKTLHIHPHVFSVYKSSYVFVQSSHHNHFLCGIVYPHIQLGSVIFSLSSHWFGQKSSVPEQSRWEQKHSISVLYHYMKGSGQAVSHWNGWAYLLNLLMYLMGDELFVLHVYIQ